MEPPVSPQPPFSLGGRMRSSSVIVLTAVVAGQSVTAILFGQEAGRKDTTSTAQDSVKARGRFALPPIVVTASIEPVRQDKIGFASSVVRAEDLAAEPTAYASGVLRWLPGVFIDEGVGP